MDNPLADRDRRHRRVCRLFRKWSCAHRRRPPASGAGLAVERTSGPGARSPTASRCPGIDGPAGASAARSAGGGVSRAWTSSSCARRRRRRWRSRRSRWRPGRGSSICRARFGSPRMNIRAGTVSRTRGRSCCHRPATRSRRRARRATSGRPGWCRIPAATPRRPRWPCCALLRGEIIATDGIIIDAASGTTGAGRKATEEFSFSEVDGDFRAYRVLRHQHTPEIERALALAGQTPLKVTFTPHLLPTRRGILATVYGRLQSGKTGADAAAAIDRFVTAGRSCAPPSRTPSACRRWSAPTGCRWAPTPIPSAAWRWRSRARQPVKGAAGQAVQNAKLMLGLEGDRPVEPTWERGVSTSAKSFSVPVGFRFGAVAAGVKQAGAARRDVALIVSETPCAAAGSFTVNRMRAAPVDYGAGRLPAMGIRAIVANSGNANAITGPERRGRRTRGGGCRRGGAGRRGGHGADGVDGRDRHSHAGRPDRGRGAGADRGAGRRRHHGRRGDPHHGPHHQGRLSRDRRRRPRREVRGHRQGVGDDPPADGDDVVLHRHRRDGGARGAAGGARRGGRGHVQHHHRRRRHVDQRRGDRARQRAVGGGGDRARQRRLRQAAGDADRDVRATWHAPSPPTARGRPSC